MECFSRAQILPEEEVRRVTNSFMAQFLTAKYTEIPSVAISSGIDSTVGLVGSHISVFKKLFSNLPDEGIFMNQDCMRTYNLKPSLDDSKPITWGSHFPSIGAMVKYNNLDKVVGDTMCFLSDELNIPEKDIRLIVQSTDSDLLSICQKVTTNIEIDTKPNSYYRHTIGMDGILGRNFNVAIKNPATTEYSDVGNVIILETEDGSNKIGVEVALGVTTILKQIKNLPHILDNYPIEASSNVNNEVSLRKLEDAIISSVALMKEGLRPLGTRQNDKMLKKYLKSLLYHSINLDLGIEEIEEIIKNYITRQYLEYKNLNNLHELISSILAMYRKTILDKQNYQKDFSKEDRLILELLNN